MIKKETLEELKKEASFLCIGDVPAVFMQDLSSTVMELKGKKAMIVIVSMENIESPKIITLPG